VVVTATPYMPSKKTQQREGRPWHEILGYTEAQGLGFVGSIAGEGSKPRLWKLQNLGPVPP